MKQLTLISILILFLTSCTIKVYDNRGGLSKKEIKQLKNQQKFK